MPIISDSRRGPFTEVGYPPALICGCALAAAAAACQLFPSASAVAMLAATGLLVVGLAARLVRRELRIRRRLATLTDHWSSAPAEGASAVRLKNVPSPVAEAA